MVNSKTARPNGFFCSCGKNVTFGSFVHENWDKPLTYNCPRCHKVWQAKAGKVTALANSSEEASMIP